MNKKVLLFDLGGVLIDWDGISPIVDLTDGRFSHEEARRFWFESQWIAKFETDQCTPDEFSSGVISELGLSISPEAFIQHLVSWSRGPFPGVLEMLNNLRPNHTLACLTNNNRLYIDSLNKQYDLDKKFHYFFVSYQTGLMKPSKDAFENVIQEIGVSAHEVVYFDDNAECVEMAKQIGIKAYKVSGFKQVKECLTSLKLT